MAHHERRAERAALLRGKLRAGWIPGCSKIESWLAGPIKVQLTPPTYDYSVVPPTPTSTPGPDAKFVAKAVTCQALVPITDQCSGPTTRYTLNLNNSGLYTTTVYVVATIQPLPQGQKHVATIHWLINSDDVGITTNTTAVVTGKGSGVLLGAYFVLQYPQPGIGTAKIYWDLPSNDSGDSPNDPYLAQTVVFGIYMPTPTPGTATPAKATPAKATPAKATPTKGADLAPGPAHRRETGTSV